MVIESLVISVRVRGRLVVIESLVIPLLGIQGRISTALLGFLSA